MDFSIRSELQKTLAEMQQFVEQEIYPLEPEVGANGFRATLPKLKAARQKVKEKGFWCPQIPKEYGGMGLTMMEHGLVSSVLGRSLMGHYAFNCQAPDSAPHQRASQILVPTNTPGFKLVRNIPVMNHEGEDHQSHAEVRFTNCRVPQKNLLGKEGTGFQIAQERLGAGRIHHCMRWLGICERAFDLMCKRSAERDLSPGKPLATRQIVQQWIAESRAEINAARLMVLEAAWKIEQLGQLAAREEISCIKFYAAGVLLNVLDRAIQTHGAMGLTPGTPLAAFLAAERGARIYDGPDEVHKMVVARQVLKKYGVNISN